MEAWLDRMAARRGYDRSQACGGPPAREVEARLAERLDYIKLAPRRVVAVGDVDPAPLRARYAEADVITAGPSLAALPAMHDTGSWLARARALFAARRDHALVSAPDALPLAAQSCELVWSNLALIGSDDPLACLREWHRVLQPDGLLMFTTYGPDTLKELRAAFAAADDAPHVHPFVDMHDLGDMLVACGFAQPVMDMEMITLTYASLDALLADLRACGSRNAHLARRRALTGKARWASMRGAYERFARDGRFPAGFEIVYGHAWKAQPRVAADGRSIVRFDKALRDKAPRDRASNTRKSA